MATPNNQFRLKLAPSTAYNFTINWGDGNSEIYNQTTSATEDLAGLTHTYASSGIYDISIVENASGGFPRIFFNGTTNTSLSTDDVKVTDILQWGNPKWTIMNDAFEGCVNLSAVATDGGASTLSGATDFTSSWNGCSSLKYFPLIDTSKSTDFYLAWNNCTSLTSFPLLNTSSSKYFRSAWTNCNSLISFPLIDTSKSTDFAFTWSKCSKLKEFPAINISSALNVRDGWSSCSSLTSFPLLSSQNVLDFSYAWSGCTSLSSFPLINTSKGTNFKTSWYNCSSLKTFPLIDTSKNLDYTNTWGSCSSLTAFPLINTLSGTNFSNTWQNCKNLSASEFPTLNLSNMINGTNCFNGVKLTTSSYSSLLTSICATNFNNNVVFHGGNSTYNTPASAARIFLVNTKGWTITDGGYQAGT